MILSAQDFQALGLSLRLAGLVTVILLFVSTPLAWWLARSRSPVKILVQALVALPLVLPPTVLGFYLLIALGPGGALGALAKSLGGTPPVFTFTGLVIGSCLYSLPFVVQPLQGAFAGLENGHLEVAATLGAAPLDRFVTVALPLARNGFLSAAVLGFAHTLGEFGVVLMIGGNIPGRTQVLSIVIYDHVEALEYGQAHLLAGGLLLFSFLLLAVLYGLNRRFSMSAP